MLWTCLFIYLYACTVIQVIILALCRTVFNKYDKFLGCCSFSLRDLSSPDLSFFVSVCRSFLHSHTDPTQVKALEVHNDSENQNWYDSENIKVYPWPVHLYFSLFDWIWTSVPMVAQGYQSVIKHSSLSTERICVIICFYSYIAKIKNNRFNLYFNISHQCYIVFTY